MSKYRVTILQTVYQSATLEIEATSEKDAAQQAHVIYTDGPELVWRVDDCDDPDIDAELVADYFEAYGINDTIAKRGK
jgi:hypothetical protein